MGREADEAAASLHLLDTHYRTHPATGPSVRRPASISPGAPLNIGVVDHIRASVDEVIEHARVDTDGAMGPLPEHPSDVYDWWCEHTEHAGPEVQQRRDIVIVRQRLEHAIRMGQDDVVCPHPCPRCTTWGLQWNRYSQRAVCLNTDCRDRDGMSSAWTLARLATQYVMDKESLKIRAT